MKFFYDTEFYEDGERIHPISFGMVAEDGRRLYGQFEFDWSIVPEGHFVLEHVRPHIASEGPFYNPTSFSDALMTFVQYPNYEKAEFWGYYPSYDHVLMCQLYGTMMDLPKIFPMYTKCLKQLADHKGFDPKNVPQDDVEHHALADAMWNKKLYNVLVEQEWY